MKKRARKRIRRTQPRFLRMLEAHSTRFSRTKQYAREQAFGIAALYSALFGARRGI